MGNIALLIIAIAFAVLVVFLVIVLHKVSKVVEEANRTVKLVSSDEQGRFGVLKESRKTWLKTTKQIGRTS